MGRTVNGAARIDVDEVVVTIPWPSTGGIWAHSGNRCAYLAKYSAPAVGRIQEVLREAKPAE
ncbi:MAG TPA: hypothetical protein VMS17_18695 [Gemmataceae bacterium]|nr:hypothetical protein [Gemmataceae bacterium]